MPWALWEVSLRRGCKQCLEVAKSATDFLLEVCRYSGYPAPIGNKGWYFKGKKKALFDQQPIDAAYMVCCLEKAYCVTGEKKYLILAKEWYDWFFGNNVKRISIVNIKSVFLLSLLPLKSTALPIKTMISSFLRLEKPGSQKNEANL